MKRVLPAVSDGSSRELLLLMGEEVKMPLISMLQLVESGGDAQEIRSYIQQAMQTIDNILLYQRVHSGQTALAFEPVHVGHAMQRVARVMEPIMQTMQCRVKLDVQHGLRPVRADKIMLEAALVCLWQGFMATLDEGAELVCQAKRTVNGVRVSLVSENTNIEELHFTQINMRSKQPIAHVAHTSVDLVSGQEMVSFLGAQVSKTQNAAGRGIGITLPFSTQLQLVS
jgi:K+-sensing histidine kinase KdpD